MLQWSNRITELDNITLYFFGFFNSTLINNGLEGTNYMLVNNKYKIRLNTTHSTKLMFLCIRRHLMSPFTSTIRCDLVFLQFDAYFIYLFTFNGIN